MENAMEKEVQKAMQKAMKEIAQLVESSNQQTKATLVGIESRIGEMMQQIKGLATEVQEMKSTLDLVKEDQVIMLNDDSMPPNVVMKRITNDARMPSKDEIRGMYTLYSASEVTAESGKPTEVPVDIKLFIPDGVFVKISDLPSALTNYAVDGDQFKPEGDGILKVKILSYGGQDVHIATGQAFAAMRAHRFKKPEMTQVHEPGQQ